MSPARSRSLLPPAIVLALLAACTGDDITGPSTSEPAAAVVSAAVPDLGGEWRWTNVEKVSMPPFLAMLLGIVPEGDLTHARCESGGTMTLQQSGGSFVGSAKKLSNACTTEGGQAFNQPGTDFVVTDGRVDGRSVRFSFATATVAPCPHRAVIAELDGGTPITLTGNGRCFLPGHPRSESPGPAGPPSRGESRTISWLAVRP